jgi:HSP20 family protein
MSTRTLSRMSEGTPSVLDDFFKPWNEWFDNAGFLAKTLKMPAVNITETKDHYQVSLAAPGLKKDDFKIDVEGNMLSISCEKEDSKEETEKKYTRREYSYRSFSRSFQLPEEVNLEKIDARYEDGVLHINLPRKENARKNGSRQISVR